MKNTAIVPSQNQNAGAIAEDYIEKIKDFASSKLNNLTEAFWGFLGQPSTELEVKPAFIIEQNPVPESEAKKLTKPKLKKEPGLFSVNYMKEMQLQETATIPVEVGFEATNDETVLLGQLSVALERTKQLEVEPESEKETKFVKTKSENQPKITNIHSLSYTLNYLREEAKKTTTPEKKEGSARTRQYAGLNTVKK